MCRNPWKSLEMLNFKRKDGRPLAPRVETAHFQEIQESPCIRVRVEERLEDLGHKDGPGTLGMLLPGGISYLHNVI